MPEYGRLHFQDLTSFEDTPRDIVEAALDELASRVGKPVEPPPPLIDWARITECVRHDTRVSLTAEDARMRASLNFDAALPERGRYFIRIPSRHEIEEGCVLNVVELTEDNAYRRAYSMLAQFPFRYVVITRAQDGKGTQRVWRVGISRFASDAAQHEDITASA